MKISDIKINREARQRRELRDIEDLAESIRLHGLITPIAVCRDGTLVAGERRLTAMISLGWTDLEHGKHYILLEEMPTHKAQALELVENVKRADLPWPDQCRAVQAYHRLRRDEFPEWSQQDTAIALGISQQHISRLLMIAGEAERSPEIMTQPKMSTAANTAQRHRERRLNSVLSTIVSSASEPETEGETAAPPPPSLPLRNGDFRELLRDWRGPEFNFIHCDFPYGINFDKSPGMSKSHTERYDDSPEYFKELVGALADLPIAENAHMLFWFSMHHYAFLRVRLKELGWKVDPFPLIWFKSDNKGIIPDSKGNGFRRVYETALFASRGSQPFVRPVENCYAGPSEATRQFISPKPKAMLRHFFRAFIDESAAFLDPTAGSGFACKVAEELGAKHVLGIEVDPNIYEDAVTAWDSPAIDL